VASDLHDINLTAACAGNLLHDRIKVALIDVRRYANL
jgi:hypothetical protein